MKKRGTPYKPLTESQIEMVKEYLTSDKGYAELATEKGVSATTLRYWANKYKKERSECMG